MPKTSEKGYFSGSKNTYGRQLVRVSAPTYHETLLSMIYPGSQNGSTTFKTSVRAVQNLLQLTREQRRQTVWRTDGGLGTDENINWALTHDYQVLMKGYNGKRALAFSRQITDSDWYPLRADRWVAVVPKAPRYARRTQTLSLRWLTEAKQMQYATLVHSLLDHDLAHDPGLIRRTWRDGDRNQSRQIWTLDPEAPQETVHGPRSVDLAERLGA